MVTGTGSEDYYPLRLFCEQHRGWSDAVPGSLLAIPEVRLGQLPEQLVQREAALHLKYWELEHGNEETSREGN